MWNPFKKDITKEYYKNLKKLIKKCENDIAFVKKNRENLEYMREIVDEYDDNQFVIFRLNNQLFQLPVTKEWTKKTIEHSDEQSSALLKEMEESIKTIKELLNNKDNETETKDRDHQQEG